MGVIIRSIKKFSIILSKHQKRRVFQLVIMMIFGGFLELLGVSLILPFMEAVTNSDIIIGNELIAEVCHIMGITEHRTFLIITSIILAAIYFLKNVYFLFQTRVQNKFVYANMFDIQERLLANYLNRPYEFFLGIKSGEVLRIVGEDTASTFSLLLSLLSLLSETIVTVMLSLTIVVLSPILTTGMILILLVLLIIILKIIRPILRRAGKESVDARTKMNQWLLQSIQGIKEVKVMQCDSFFKSNFHESGKKYVKTLYESLILGIIPRFLIEASIMSSFFIVVALLIYNGASLAGLVPMLSAIAMAMVRILPATNRISQSLASLSFNEIRLDNLIKYLNEMDGSCKGVESNLINKREMSDKFDYLEMRDIKYHYPSTKEYVLDNAKLTVKHGKSIGIVGVSGAGKTTAVDIMMGLLKPESGSVCVNGINILNHTSDWLSRIGYVPQNIFMLDGNIRENVAFGLGVDEVNDKEVWNVLEEAALGEFVRNLPEGLNTELGERGVRLSGGQRQRIGIARALYNDPDILFFDEATSALDHETENAIMESIIKLQGKKTMVIIAHRLTTIESCDEIYRVENGKIFREK